ncbi:NAD(P)/FAD-dependent oxidoreductase [Staphylococcus agnetis]|uniref:NAD(P)/FAD-dependent oxidoreductase n=1 Tax=Staphylococcus agnetis TaxID=985762 RepID=UPI00208FD1A8|nr:FAD/NAD(P)-binding oxidoreductase [Staphylococcus agnetis]MCO4344600.1 NAD(P)/FAD-dependent oxidoreductase [Staphylococcus agnetis]MCO4346928.1 NAD(P)/FAD-dependent oxidoreductase [Staphylococcus agnetis]MCO4354048.1 NAD(P)/FAD-dependent oxidoreductase [Staphylococcus agnetis]MCO4358866.1 NAD(P)/FAD-dependent oxidoreductase [Staphylococcus agnetis]MCO4363562.1 NAD(P)/FAD-dependent oxidoreductase [Staphylococcus agnetis]
MSQHYEVVVIGGGTAGIMVTSKILRQDPSLKGKIAIIDPASHHYYQPLWTLVGAGVSKLESTRKPMGTVIPQGANWLQQAVKRIAPHDNMVYLQNDESITYTYLVVCPGLQLNWSHVKGLPETIGKHGVCSNYAPQYVNETWRQISQFKGGTAIFTHPNTPIKCGGAPMKIMFLAEDYFRKHGVRPETNVYFETSKDVLFDVETYSNVLEDIVEKRDIHVEYQSNLVEVNGEEKRATFENIKTGARYTRHFDMLHVTPPMGPLDFVKESGLTDEAGWIDVNPSTLQHTQFNNVFALGDASNAPTSKTGAAIRKQAPVVAANVLQAMKDNMLTHHYDGYTSCPIVTGYNQLILAEFDYNHELKETMPFNQAKPRRSMYVLKKDILPKLYWYGMLKGLM